MEQPVVAGRLDRERLIEVLARGGIERDEQEGGAVDMLGRGFGRRRFGFGQRVGGKASRELILGPDPSEAVC